MWADVMPEISYSKVKEDIVPFCTGLSTEIFNDFSVE